MAVTEILLGVTLVVSGATAYAASLRRAGYAAAAPFLAAAFAAAGWLMAEGGVLGLPQILLGGAAAVLGLAFVGEGG